MIDWDRDVVFAFRKGQNPHEDILKFFGDRNRLAESHVYSAGRYVLDIETALKLQIRFGANFETFAFLFLLMVCPFYNILAYQMEFT